MKPVLREDLVDYQTYEAIRPSLRQEVLAAKAARRVHVGAYLTFLFENATRSRRCCGPNAS